VLADVRIGPVKDLIFFGAFLGGWFLLQLVILPRLGVST
jgi:hypothetical protein